MGFTFGFLRESFVRELLLKYRYKETKLYVSWCAVVYKD